MPIRTPISTTRRWRSAGRAPFNCAGRRATTWTAPGILDPAAIAQVAAESWPVVRDADELHDALTSLIVLPAVAAWRAWFEELVAERRATLVNDELVDVRGTA